MSSIIQGSKILRMPLDSSRQGFVLISISQGFSSKSKMKSKPNNSNEF